jgi:hypothetical protein
MAIRLLIFTKTSERIALFSVPNDKTMSDYPVGV